MINFRCDQCNQKLSVPDVHAGQKVKCSGCKNVTAVPQIQKIQIRKASTAAQQPLLRQSDNQESESNQPVHPADTANHTSISCKNCGKEYRISSGNLGRKFTCTECGSEFSSGQAKSDSVKPDGNLVCFVCSMCQHELKAPESMRGKTVTCPHCDCYAEVPKGRSKPDTSNESDQFKLAEVAKDCPYCGEEIRENAKKCKHCGEFLEGASFQAHRIGYGGSTPPPVPYANPNLPVYQAYSTRTPKGNKSKITAFLLAWFLGGIGVHKFYLDQPGWGVVYLLLFWTWIPGIVAFIEGILYLCMSEEDFNMKYNT